MKHLITLFLWGISLPLLAQMETRFFPDGDALSGTPFSTLSQIRVGQITRQMPDFDSSCYLLEDSLIEADHMGDVPYRFGKDFEVNNTLNDGIWSYTGDGRIWSMSFSSQGAYSLNFIFENFNLPPGAELYLSNEDETMLYGPITSLQNPRNGTFFTDLVSGDKVTIYLFEPEKQEGKSSLTIKKVIHAYRDLYSLKGTSLNCRNNVDCYPAYNQESRGVALVLLGDGTALCSGSLLMTTNQNFKPYFLTAFHCLDTNPSNGVLSQTEQNAVGNWMFRFGYKQSCSGGQSLFAQTYNGSSFRSALFDSDFALLELNAIPLNSVWLGWDRRNIASSFGAQIHHPEGDYMKISFDNHPAVLNSSSISWNNNTASPVNTHWTMELDNGSVERGSSGSPYLNSDKRVVGQMHGGGISCPPQKVHNGAFHYSWDHNTSSSAQLKYWLDPANTGKETTNSSYYPHISGDLIVCGIKYYTLENVSSGNVTWNVSGDLGIVSGQGTQRVGINAQLHDLSGLGKITATTATGVTVFYNVYSVAPTVQSIGGVKSPTWGQYFMYFAEPYIKDIIDQIDYDWSVSPSADLEQQSDRRACRIRFPSPGTYTISCRSRTSCGIQHTTWTTQTITTAGFGYTVSQQGRLLTICQKQTKKNTNNIAYTIYELTTGQTKKTGVFNTEITTDLSNLNPGTYLVKIGDDDTQKIILQ